MGLGRRGGCSQDRPRVRGGLLSHPQPNRASAPREGCCIPSPPATALAATTPTVPATRSAASRAVAAAAYVRKEVPRPRSCTLAGATSWVLLPPAAPCPRVTSVTSRPCLARAGDASIIMPTTLPRGPASRSPTAAVGGTPTTSGRWRSASRSASNWVRGGAALGQTELHWAGLGQTGLPLPGQRWGPGRGWERRAALPAAGQPDPEGLLYLPAERGWPPHSTESGSIPHCSGTWCGGLRAFMLGDFNQLAALSWELVSFLVRTRQQC